MRTRETIRKFIFISSGSKLLQEVITRRKNMVKLQPRSETINPNKTSKSHESNLDSRSVKPQPHQHQNVYI